MENLIIFGAKYLFILSPLIVIGFFYMSSSEIRQRMLSFAIFSLPLTYVLGVVARELYFNPRPFMVSGVEPLISHTADNGFPSDHLLLLASLAALISFFDRKWAIPLWVIAALVGISRILAGVHRSIDILGSIAIALISAGLVYFVLNHKKQL